MLQDQRKSFVIRADKFFSYNAELFLFLMKCFWIYRKPFIADRKAFWIYTKSFCKRGSVSDYIGKPFITNRIGFWIYMKFFRRRGLFLNSHKKAKTSILILLAGAYIWYKILKISEKYPKNTIKAIKFFPMVFNAFQR